MNLSLSLPTRPSVHVLLSPMHISLCFHSPLVLFSLRENIFLEVHKHHYQRELYSKSLEEYLDHHVLVVLYTAGTYTHNYAGV